MSASESGGEQVESHSEELLYRELPDGSLLVHFHFQSSAPLQTHYTTFPRVVKQLVATQSMEELELSFTHGHWRPKWGRPWLQTKPVGAELWAKFSRGNATQRSDRWRRLTNALSGLFCASLDLMDNPLASSGSLGMSGLGGGRGGVEYGVLPREAVCTENLTPWLKLLPCRDVAGLAALLDRPLLYSADYHSLRTHLLVSPPTPRDTRSIALTQTLTLVLRQTAAQSAALMRAAASSPSDLLMSPWPSRPAAEGALPLCPAAVSSALYWAPAGLGEEGLRRWEVRGPSRAWADVSEAVVPVVEEQTTTPTFRRWPSLSAQMYLAGEPGELNTIVIEVSLQPDEAAGDHLLCINQLIPWYARARLHTLSLLLDGRPAAWTEHSARSRLLPPRDRQRPATLELCLANVTALASLLHLTVVFDKAFLTVTEHPPDAHRGFDIPAAMVFLMKPQFADDDGSCALGANETRRAYSGYPLWQALLRGGGSAVGEDISLVVYTEGLLLSLALPDFSMPYNVTCFTSTLLAVYLGTLLGSLVRRPAVAVEQARRKGWRAKATRVALVSLIFGFLMLALDVELQRQVGQALGTDLEAAIVGLF